MAGLALLWLPAPAHAGMPTGPDPQYAAERWGSDKGLPDGSVTAIAQTRDGYLWIGTDKGLVRFDGLNFRLFEQASPGAFSIGGVQALQADDQGNLWVLLQNTRILRYRDGDFEPGRDLAEFGITAIAKRNDGAILLSSLSSGMLVSSGGIFKPLPFATADSIISNRSRFYAKPNSALTLVEPPDQAVTSILESTDGGFWLGTKAGGLFKTTRNQLDTADRGLTKTRITCLLSLGNGNLWIGTDKGLRAWSEAASTTAHLPFPLREARVLAMVRDHHSNIWVGTDRGLFVVDQSATSHEQVRRISSAPISALFEDREGNLWVGGNGAIQRLRYRPFFTYAGNGLQSGNSGPLYVDRRGRVWFAPAGGGLHRLRDGRNETIRTDNLENDVVYSITGIDDEVWIGRRSGGLTLLQDKGGSITSTTYHKAEGLAQDSVYTVYRAHDGTVWAGTLTGGVSRIRQGRFTTYTTANGLASNTVTSITEGSDGTVWFATPNGLSALSGDRWSHFAVTDGLPSAELNCLLSDSKGILWIGSADGLAYLSSGQIHVPSHLPETLREQVFGMAEDRTGWLWISTQNRLLRINRMALLEGRLSEADTHQYGPADGLLGTAGVKRDRSVVVDQLDRIWLSTNRGLSVANTTRFVNEYPPILVHLDAPSADGSPVATVGPVSIPSSRQRITFSYIGLSLADPESVRYRYRLDGFDRDWSEPVATRTAVYTNLRQGSYHFRVIASNRQGVWSDSGASLDLDVTPVWFQTNWFRSLSTISMMLSVWAIYRLRVRWISNAISARFDERLAERTRLARDLHDTLLQTIQGSKMVAENALDEAADLSHMRRSMEQLAMWLGQATKEGRNALQSLRTSANQTNDLAEGFRQALDGCRLRGLIDARLVVDGTVRNMHPIVRDEIYWIGYEAIRNACQHSGAMLVDVLLSYELEFTLRIFDNGKGMEPGLTTQGKAGHYGLQGMRERALRIGAKLTLSSAPGHGTRIQLVVPGRIVYRSAKAMRSTPLARIKNLLKWSDRRPDLD